MTSGQGDHHDEDARRVEVSVLSKMKDRSMHTYVGTNVESSRTHDSA